VRVIAFYLPQFHRFLKTMNGGEGLHGVDKRGEGETIVPGALSAECASDLGFYDLRVPECGRHRQVWLAPQESRGFVTGITGLLGSGFWSGRSMRCSSPGNRIFRFVWVGQPNLDGCLAWEPQAGPG